MKRNVPLIELDRMNKRTRNDLSIEMNIKINKKLIVNYDLIRKKFDLFNRCDENNRR